MITIADCEKDNICTYFVLSFMLSFDVIIFHGQQMLSLLCYHFPLYIFCVIIYVIIWCYHLLLSYPSFFLFPENVTNSFLCLAPLFISTVSNMSFVYRDAQAVKLWNFYISKCNYENQKSL
jgi:hypothetical protein